MSAIKEDHRLAMCRVVGVMLVTDGQLTDEEYDFFTGLLDRMDISDERRGEVTGAISIDTDITGDVAMLKDGGLADALLEELRKAASVDGEESKIEKSVLAMVEEALASDAS